MGRRTAQSITKLSHFHAHVFSAELAENDDRSEAPILSFDNVDPRLQRTIGRNAADDWPQRRSIPAKLASIFPVAIRGIPFAVTISTNEDPAA